MKAIVDPEKCTCCGICVDTCPEVFEIDGPTARAKVELVPAAAEESCRRAAEDCPSAAITVEA